MAHRDRIWWRCATPSADGWLGQPCTNKGILAWLCHSTLRPRSLYLPETTQIPYSHYRGDRALFIHPAGPFPNHCPSLTTGSHVSGCPASPPTPNSLPLPLGSLTPQGSKLFCGSSSSCNNTNEEASGVSHHFKVCAHTFPHLS